MRIAVLAVAAALCATAAAACPDDDAQRRVLDRINRQRGEGVRCGAQWQAAVPPLGWSDAVAAVAQAHAQAMARSQRLGHEDESGRDGGRRLADAGLEGSAWAENLARGRVDGQRLVALWFGSAGHCANLMLAGVSHAGLGCARGADGDDYWALLLWRPRSVSRATGSPTATTRNPPAAVPRHD